MLAGSGEDSCHHEVAGRELVGGAEGARRAGPVFCPAPITPAVSVGGLQLLGYDLHFHPLPRTLRLNPWLTLLLTLFHTPPLSPGCLD